MGLAQLRGQPPHQATQKAQGAPCRQDTRPAPRVRIMSWNAGGLNSIKYQEVLVWLQAESDAGRGLDVCILQETAWPMDSEFTAGLDGPGAVKWHAVHSAGKGHDGILCLLRAGFFPSEQIRYNIIVPGRLLHIRALLTVPLDLLCIYQWAWNPGKAEFNGKNRQEEMLRQRRRIWQSVDKWLGSIPQRSTCMMAGDFNCGLLPEATICGQGIANGGGTHPDQGALQELVQLLVRKGDPGKDLHPSRRHGTAGVSD